MRSRGSAESQNTTPISMGGGLVFVGEGGVVEMGVVVMGYRGVGGGRRVGGRVVVLGVGRK